MLGCSEHRMVPLVRLGGHGMSVFPIDSSSVKTMTELEAFFFYKTVYLELQHVMVLGAKQNNTSTLR